jgi:hypothetical protein
MTAATSPTLAHDGIQFSFSPSHNRACDERSGQSLRGFYAWPAQRLAQVGYARLAQATSTVVVSRGRHELSRRMLQTSGAHPSEVAPSTHIFMTPHRGARLPVLVIRWATASDEHGLAAQLRELDRLEGLRPSAGLLFLFLFSLFFFSFFLFLWLHHTKFGFIQILIFITSNAQCKNISMKCISILFVSGLSQA